MLRASLYGCDLGKFNGDGAKKEDVDDTFFL